MLPMGENNIYEQYIGYYILLQKFSNVRTHVSTTSMYIVMCYFLDQSTKARWPQHILTKFVDVMLYRFTIGYVLSSEMSANCD